MLPRLFKRKISVDLWRIQKQRKLYGSLLLVHTKEVKAEISTLVSSSAHLLTTSYYCTVYMAKIAR
jgi:hypothetical protein